MKTQLLFRAVLFVFLIGLFACGGSRTTTGKVPFSKNGGFFEEPDLPEVTENLPEQESPAPNVPDQKKEDTEDDRFGVPVKVSLDDASGPVLLEVDSVGAAKIIQYPEVIRGKIEFLPSGFDVKNGGCKRIEELVSGYVSAPAELKKEFSDVIRSMVSVSINIHAFSDLMGDQFDRAVLNAAQKLGLAVSSVQIVNPLSLKKVELELQVEENALAPKLGDLDKMKEEVLVSFSEAYFFRFGIIQHQTSARDFICDLYSGQIKIILVLKTEDDHEIRSELRP